MLEIKTISFKATEHEEFDEAVNNALRDGWELMRREILPPYEGDTCLWERALYAELEREVEAEEEEEPARVDAGTAMWKLSRDPALPYRCDTCGGKSHEPTKFCPHCERLMLTGGTD